MFYYGTVFFIGAICTQLLHVYVLNPVLASTVFMSAFCIGVLGIKDWHHLAMPALSGSLAGMMATKWAATGILESKAANVDWSVFIFACIVAGYYMIVYLFDNKGPFQKIGEGFGGRMGTTAFITCMGFYFTVHDPSFPTGILLEGVGNNLKFMLFCGVFSSFACGLTLLFRYITRLQIPNLNIPLGASLVGLAFAIPTYFDIYGVYLAAAAYSGTFVGMTVYDVIDKRWILILLALANGITIWFISYLFLGFGGTMGLSAFTTISTYFLIRYIIGWTKSTNA